MREADFNAQRNELACRECGAAGLTIARNPNNNVCGLNARVVGAGRLFVASSGYDKAGRKTVDRVVWLVIQLRKKFGL